MGKEKFREPRNTEQIAYVVKKMGGKICKIFYLDGTSNEGKTISNCRIPGKFTKNKKKNFIADESFVLIDFHKDFSNKESCEIIEVYNDCYRNHIINNYKNLINAYANHLGNHGKINLDDNIEFDNNIENNSIPEQKKIEEKKHDISILDEFNFDDI